MSASLSLKRAIKITDNGTTLVTFTAIGEEMTSDVFAIEILPGSADPTCSHYRFSHVCHPSELLEFPTEETLDYSYFRTNEIEMIFDTPTPVECLTSRIVADLRHLMREYNEFSELDDTESTIVIS
jgi:hypothetical protein